MRAKDSGATMSRPDGYSPACAADADTSETADPTGTSPLTTPRAGDVEAAVPASRTSPVASTSIINVKGYGVESPTTSILAPSALRFFLPLASPPVLLRENFLIPPHGAEGQPLRFPLQKESPKQRKELAPKTRETIW
ncbi:hypothetical protein AMTR_s00034p00150800 [Amborella trichopoda]|uniref:Uncharacterized protein n=1 Tax=Amborella trichopoda TaxID=13333 RepID=W1PXP1_AMBTC|nr:hypothetical protein AMTR_s00034p00150800 [Amborella trichopoda]